MSTFRFGQHTIRSSEVFFQSKLSLGLVNLKPITPGHVLVITKRGTKRFQDLTSEEVSDLFQAAQVIGTVIEEEYNASSLTFAMQDGKEAGQTVEHVHLHIIPRKVGDWLNNDDVYKEINSNESQMGSHYTNAEKNDVQRKPGGVDFEERTPRSFDEMAEEASRLRRLLSQTINS